MPSLSQYKKSLVPARSAGEARKLESDQIMERTWWEDINSKIGYVYDFYHDDEPLLLKGLHPDQSKTKVAVPIKFLSNAFNSENKDQVGYHIQFQPSFRWENVPALNYYKQTFVEKYDSEYPIGLYLDIEDEKGVFRKWLVTENANWLGNQFPTWYILPCDHIFQWIYEGNMYQMAGVSRSQSSYNKLLPC